MRGMALTLACAIAALVGTAPAAAARPPRVAAGFFGMNVPPDATAGDAVARLGLGTVRLAVGWRDVQRDPERPSDWRHTDAAVADLARHGLRAQPPLVAYSAAWAQPPEQRPLGDQTFAPARPATYAAFARAP